MASRRALGAKRMYRRGHARERRALLLVAGETGLRQGEIIALEWGDADLWLRRSPCDGRRGAGTWARPRAGALGRAIPERLAARRASDTSRLLV
jgi:integrase